MVRKLVNSEHFIKYIITGFIGSLISAVLILGGMVLYKNNLETSIAVIDLNELIALKAKELASSGKDIKLIQDQLDIYKELFNQEIETIAKSQNLIILNKKAHIYGAKDITHTIIKRLELKVGK